MIFIITNTTTLDLENYRQWVDVCMLSIHIQSDISLTKGI